MKNLTIARLSDRDIAAKLDKIAALAEVNLQPVQFVVFERGTGPVTFPQKEGENVAWQAVMAANGHSIGSFSATVGGGAVTFSYHRGGTGAAKSPYFDEVAFTLDSGRAEAIVLAVRVAAAFEPVDVGSGSPPNDHVGALQAIHQSTLGRLERILEDGLARTTKHAEDLDQRHAQRVATTDADFVQKEKDLRAALDADREALARDIAQLASDRKALDDRSNTHARRAIRDKMLDDVQSRIKTFGVSQATESKRGAVQAGFVALFVLGIGALVWSAHELQLLNRVSIDAPSWTFSLLWARLLLVSIGVAATLVYYIRWQSSWADQHARSEFELQKFYLDVNRANWTIESCLEWRKETASNLPDPLIESVTRGLFASSDAKDEPALHPADELAKAILGSSSRVKLQAGDSEIEIEKPGKALKKVDR